jgi:hypothetical protein
MWSLPRSLVSPHEDYSPNFRTTTEHRNSDEHVCTTPQSPSSPTSQVVSLPNLINPPHTHEGGVGGSYDSFLKSERSSSASMMPSLKLLGGFGAFITKANNNNQRRSSDSSDSCGKTATLSADQSVNVTFVWLHIYMPISNPVVFVHLLFSVIHPSSNSKSIIFACFFNFCSHTSLNMTNIETNTHTHTHKSW